MKKILLLLCSLILIGCGGQTHEDGPFRWYYENGNIRTEGTYKNDIMVGVIKEYNEDGTLKSERTYVNGKKEGPAVFYWVNGDREERTYVNDTIEGPAVFYASDSGKWKGDREERTYVNGKREGPSVYYWVNGNREERTYVNGKKEGPAVYYYADGRTKNKTYVNGKSQSSSSSNSYNSSSGSQKGRYILRGDISFTIVVSGSGDSLEYSGFSNVYGVQGNVSGTIKNNTLYEDGVMGIGSIDRNGKWIQYDGHTIYK